MWDNYRAGFRVMWEGIPERQREALRAVAPATATIPIASSISIVWEVTHWRWWTVIAASLCVGLDLWAWIRFRPHWTNFWERVDNLQVDEQTGHYAGTQGNSS